MRTQVFSLATLSKIAFLSVAINLAGCGGTAISSSLTSQASSNLAVASSLSDLSSSAAPASSMATAISSSNTQSSQQSFSSQPMSSSIVSSLSSQASISSSSSTVANLLKIDALGKNLCAHDGADEKIHTGFDGEGYYNGSNIAGAGFSLSINASAAGDYPFTIKYANGDTKARTANVQIGLAARDKKMNFANTGSWDQWQEATITIALNKGENSISLTAFEDVGLANIDSVSLKGMGLSVNACPAPKTLNAPFMVGMDISSIPELMEFNIELYDTDGQPKDMLSLLKNHGVNFIRLRTFVDPKAPSGYASMDATCPGKTEAYNDQAHLVAFAKKIKQAGFGLLLDIQYSDTWTDPGKQIIPVAWRNIKTLTDMATQVRTYTRNLVTVLSQAGAKPEMVQVGNEITAGMLVHLPTSTTTCWGDNPVVNSAVNGSAQNWDNLATLLKAGIAGVTDVDQNIKVMLHIENTGSLSGLQWWVDNAQQRNVKFDVLGLSAYEPYQGPSSSWQSTIDAMAKRYPQLKFAVVEYNQEITLVNKIIKQLPNNQGVGTFFWEPTQSGHWGEGLFNWSDKTATAKSDRFGELDNFVKQYNLK